jgi:selenocysteine-specific elongation factor
MLTIATAGHIDHGKSSLVKALTSIDPDRLPEEKERGMTIDLGFAWLELPSGETVGIVDVPGHKQFVHNVIPGLFGIDAVLLVVAADDSWMPQTEEHLRILDLLGITHGIVVLNKVDLVSDPEWLSLVEKDILGHLAGTILADSPIMRVSTRTGTGIEELKKSIAALSEQLAPRKDIRKPRLAVDRVFVIKGSGAVVTGTLSQGTFSTGNDVVIAPSDLIAHIRSMESYKKETKHAEPGSRLAVNLTGIKREDVKRGDIVVSSAQYTPLSRTIDTDLKLLSSADAPLKNMAEVLVYMETRELLTRVALIGAKAVKPGETCPTQLRFQENVAAFIGERFIVRQQSPAKTIGGGVVLDPQASRFKLVEIPARLAYLERRRGLNLDELILSELQKNHFAEAKSLLAASPFPQSEINTHVKQLASQKKLVQAGIFAVDSNVWGEASLKLITIIEKGQEAEALKHGVSLAAAQSALGLPRDVFDTLVQHMASKGKLARQEDTLFLPENKPALSKQQEALRQSMLGLFVKNPSSPPSLKELGTQFPDSSPVVHFMIRQGELVELAEGILMEAKQFKGIQDEVIKLLRQNVQISIQDINARFGFSRKYSVPLLTQFDRLGITRREGDVRVPGKKLASQSAD